MALFGTSESGSHFIEGMFFSLVSLTSCVFCHLSPSGYRLAWDVVGGAGVSIWMTWGGWDEVVSSCALCCWLVGEAWVSGNPMMVKVSCMYFLPGISVESHD